MNKKLLISALCLAASFSSDLSAGKLVVANKIPDQSVQLFIRGEGSETHYVEVIEAAQLKELMVETTNVQGKPTFEVIASTGKGGNPDWKLMGGKAGDLVTIADHVLVIDSTAGKVSCTNKTADNSISNLK